MSKPLIELITCESGDWNVLKLNGKKYYEAHMIPKFIWLDLLQSLGYKIKTKEISDEDMEMGKY